MAKEDLISLEIGKDVVIPIVEKHIKSAVLERLAGTFKNSWTSRIDIKIEPIKNN